LPGEEKKSISGALMGIDEELEILVLNLKDWRK